VTVDEALAELENAKGNYSCANLVALLELLGFSVEPCKSEHHKKVKHSGLREFRGSGFSCEHGKNPNVKRGYIGKMKTMLTIWKDELEKLS